MFSELTVLILIMAIVASLLLSGRLYRLPLTGLLLTLVILDARLNTPFEALFLGFLLLPLLVMRWGYSLPPRR